MDIIVALQAGLTAVPVIVSTVGTTLMAYESFRRFRERTGDPRLMVEPGRRQMDVDDSRTAISSDQRLELRAAEAKLDAGTISFIQSATYASADRTWESDYGVAVFRGREP